MRRPYQIIVAAHVALFIYYLQATIIVQPFWDMYAHVLRYLDFREGGTWWAYLWEPHVQHRHVWVRLLTAFDAEAFSGVAYPFVITSACAMAIAAWLLWRESRRIDPPELGTAVGLLVVMLVLTSVGAVVCAIPMNSVYPQLLVFTVLALILFEGPAESEPGTPRLLWSRLAALLAAAGAAFGNAAALALWPILGWMSWRRGAGRAWTIAVILFGGAFTVSYLRGLPLTPEGAGASSPTGLDRLFRTTEYLLTYMGLPWTRAAALAVPGRIVGAGLLLAGVWGVIWRGFLRPRGGRLERLAVGGIMFSLAAAGMASAGRVDVGPELAVPVRYSLLLMPLHAGMLWLAYPYVSRQWAIESRRPAIRALMLGAGVLLVVQQVAAGEAAVATTRSMRATIQRFIAGEEDPDAARVVFNDLEEARDASDRIRAAGLYTESP